MTKAREEEIATAIEPLIVAHLTEVLDRSGGRIEAYGGIDLVRQLRDEVTRTILYLFPLDKGWKPIGFVNVYRDEDNELGCSQPFKTETEARENIADKAGLDYLGCDFIDTFPLLAAPKGDGG
jgi:hypothetical protein